MRPFVVRSTRLGRCYGQETCPSCAAAKRPFTSFCDPCLARLPDWLRTSLVVDDMNIGPEFADRFKTAYRMLTGMGWENT